MPLPSGSPERAEAAAGAVTTGDEADRCITADSSRSRAAVAGMVAAAVALGLITGATDPSTADPPSVLGGITASTPTGRTSAPSEFTEARIINSPSRSDITSTRVSGDKTAAVPDVRPADDDDDDDGEALGPRCRSSHMLTHTSRAAQHREC